MENPLRIALCEDLDTDATLLLDLIRQSGFPSKIERFSSGEELLRSFTAGRYDLIFMDIFMNGIRGIEAVEVIRKTDEEVVIAFTTASLDYTLESYRLGALKYLEKPVTMDSVKETLKLALMNRKPRASINILTGGKYIDILLDSIHYFEQRDHVVEVHMSSGILRTSQTVRMTDIEKRIPSPPFVRCHHSFIVNLNFVCKVDMDYHFFVMKNGERAHIRHNLLKKMKAVHEDYMFSETRASGI